MLLRIILFVVCFHAAFSSLRITVSLDALAHGAAPSEIGVLMALITFVPTLCSVHFGRWIDTSGAERPVFASSLALAAAAALPFLFPAASWGLVPLGLCCVLNGAGFQAAEMCARYLAGFSVPPEKRVSAFAWIALGFSVSGLVMPVVIGAVIDAFGHRWAYAAAGAACAAGMALYARARSTLPVPPRRPRSAAGATVSELIRAPGLWRVLAVSGIVSMAWDLQIFMFPVYGHSIGLSATEIGWMISSFFCATLIVRFALPAISRVCGEWQCLTATLLIASASYLALPMFTAIGPLLAVAFALGLGLGISNPNIMSLLHAISPAGRTGEVLGLRTMISNGCHCALPLAYGVLLSALSAASLFYASSGLLALTSAITLGRKRAGRS